MLNSLTPPELERDYDTENHRAKHVLLRASFALNDLNRALEQNAPTGTRAWSASVCYYFVEWLHHTRRPLATKYGYPAISAAMRK